MTSATVGSFALGSGTIDSNPYYYFFVKTGNGVQLGKVNALKTRLVEEDGVPRVICYESKCKSKLMHILLFANDLVKDHRYALYVPKGTIITDYNIDLGNVGR